MKPIPTPTHLYSKHPVSCTGNGYKDYPILCTAKDSPQVYAVDPFGLKKLLEEEGEGEICQDCLAIANDPMFRLKELDI